MTRLRDRIEAIKRELAIGRGGRIWPHPVPIEPPFAIFDPLPQQGRHESTTQWPLVDFPRELKFLRVRPSKADVYSQALSEQLILSLNPSYPVGWEVLGLEGRVHMQASAVPQDIATISNQITAHYQNCEAFEAQDVLLEIAAQLEHACAYRLRRSHLFMLKELLRTEPYAALAGLLGGLKSAEAALFQVLFLPTKHDWRGNILRVSQDPFDPRKSAFSDRSELPKLAQAKASKPLFAVALRLGASSEELLVRMEGSFLSQFQGEENSLVPMTERYPLNALISRTTYDTGMLLNLGELAALVHIPDPGLTPEPLLTALPGAPAPVLARRRILVPLGVNRHRGVEAEVGMSGEQLSRHLAIFGGTGYGKTNLMKHAFAPLLKQDYGMAILDPKGDLAQGFLELVPQHRIQDVVWFDPTDRDHPPALNVLQASNDLEDETLTAELMVGLKRLFQGNAEFGPRMEWLLRNAIRTLLASEGEKTLYHVPRFLEDPTFRKSVLATVRDRDLREFWQRRNLSQTVVDPVLNRLSRFLDRPTIKNIVSQPNKIDFRQILRDKKIFIANLEKGVLQDNAYVLGSFILSRLQLAALARRADERTLFPILVDEFHNFAGPGMDTTSIETFLAEARSYNAPLVMATQYVGHLNREVVTALFGNVGTLVCLHLGQTDAQVMQRELGQFSTEDLLDLGIGEAIVRMGSAHEAFNVTVPLMGEQLSYRDAIVTHSRQHYCRPRSEVEASLGRVMEPGPQDADFPERSGQKQDIAVDVPQVSLTPDQWRMLEYLADHHEETVTAVYQALVQNQATSFARVRG
jgi:hypothetical protein